ncbi:MAG: hypothetical protein DI586_11175, partial [Micavibrio aeruginosavorus]
MIGTDKYTSLDEDEIDIIDDLATDDPIEETDFDDSEDGIFSTPSPDRKKSGVLAGGVIILCLLSGAAFYFYNKGNTSYPQPSPLIAASG